MSARGTSNANKRGNNVDRRRRREWLVEAYQADQTLMSIAWDDGTEGIPEPHVLTRASLLVHDGVSDVIEHPTCRCYRCGRFLTVDTVTVDRIVPGCLGGSYAHNNIRPACMDCNAETGARMANLTALRVGKMRARILKKSCTYCGAQPGQRCWGRNDKNISTFHAPRRAVA